MRLRAGLLVVLATAVPVGRASAAPHATDAPVRRTQAVAAFPDVTPGPPPVASFQDEKPPPPPDPSLELLATNPYEGQVAAALAAMNLYGDDGTNPYADELRLANPYTDELRFENPYSRRR